MIAVEEIIKELESVEFNYDLKDSFKDNSLTPTVIRYWKEVSEEIKNLHLPINEEKIAYEKKCEEKKEKEKEDTERKIYEKLKNKFEVKK